METPVIEIDMDKKCERCGKEGATQSGLCLECAANGVIDKVIDKLKAGAMDTERVRELESELTVIEDEVNRIKDNLKNAKERFDIKLEELRAEINRVEDTQTAIPFGEEEEPELPENPDA